MADDERDLDDVRPDADDRLAATLREVTVPAEVRGTGLGRLFDDESIDRLLRAVPCPPAAVERMLRPSRRRVPVDLAVAASRLGDPVATDGPGGVGIEVTAFPAPARSTEHRSWHVLRLMIRGAMDGASVAVVLVAAAGLLWASAGASRWLASPGPTRRDADVRSADRVAIVADDDGAGSVSGRSTTPPSPSDPAPGVVVSAEARRSDDRGRGPDGAVGRGLESGIGSRFAGGASAGIGPGDVGDAAAGQGGRSPSDAAATRVRAAPVDRAILGPSGPPMAVVPPTRSAARPVPSHRGYDLAFEMAHGVPPFVDPSLAPALAVDHPPLCTRTDTFDAAVRAAVGGRHVREALRGLRVEHVLAALPASTDLPSIPGSIHGSIPGKPDGDPLLSMRGFPTFRSGVASRFLEIEASAAPSVAPADPSRVVLVLDASSAAAADEAWPAVCRAVRDVASGMDADARMSVLVFADRPVVAADGMDRRGIVAVCDRLERLRLRGGGDLHGSMPAVHRLLERPSDAGRPRCVIVAHVGSIARAERDGDEDLAAWRSAHAGDEPSSGRVDEYVVIDPARGRVGSAAVRGEASPIDGIGLDAESIRRRIVEAVRGEPETVEGHQGTALSLRDCRLEVAFDPRQVAAYRLVGHRQQVSDFDRAAVATVDLEPGRTVRVVYEVMLKSQASQKSPPPAVARSTFRFRRAADGSDGAVEASIMASEFRLDPPANAPLAWAVWLGVGLGEYAAGSPHVESRADLLRRLQDRSARWGDAGWAEPTVRRLLLLLRASAGDGVRDQLDAVEFDGAD